MTVKDGVWVEARTVKVNGSLVKIAKVNGKAVMLRIPE
jgi:hypothetical protein